MKSAAHLLSNSITLHTQRQETTFWVAWRKGGDPDPCLNVPCCLKVAWRKGGSLAEGRRSLLEGALLLERWLAVARRRWRLGALLLLRVLCVLSLALGCECSQQGAPRDSQPPPQQHRNPVAPARTAHNAHVPTRHHCTA
eukprot:3940299-Rhodomonas_salina.4